MKRSFSVAGSSAGGRSVSMMSLANGGRMGSPLNPFREGRSDAGDGGRERARKKQLVWDPEKGLVSQEALDREKEVSRFVFFLVFPLFLFWCGSEGFTEVVFCNVH